MYQSNNQRQFARKLRSEMTDAERKLWQSLRKRQLKSTRFRRQHAVGPYIVDFECFEYRLIVELDGGQHNTLDGREHDVARTSYLESVGYRVIRFWNDAVIEDTDSVLEAMALQLTKPNEVRPHPGPPPQAGKGV